MNILVIDNQDSFVYNLVHYLEAYDHEITVKRPTGVSEININLFDKVVLSPGPGLPHESGELLKAIELWHKSIPPIRRMSGTSSLSPVLWWTFKKFRNSYTRGIDTDQYFKQTP